MTRISNKLSSDTKDGESLIVIGNGPSLRGFDFARLAGIDTLGMNAAYRYWDRIDWRPTHYACLDDALIETHHTEILRLINESRIKTFFLSGRMLDLEPDLAGLPNVRFLDEFVPYWFAARGKKHGLSLVDNIAFRTEQADLITTGAYAVRYGAFLGYEQITLLGIDLTYQMISEADPVDNLRLVMTQTPADNPNYFFDDYQQQGDTFQVPNPESHAQELHTAAFEAIRDDFHREHVPVRVVNSNRHSRLNSEAILPFEELGHSLGELALGSVIVPLTAAEQDQVLDNLWLWSQPAFFPFLGVVPKRRPDLVFICNNAEAARLEPKVHIFFAEETRLRACFEHVRFVTLDLAGDADLYRRENHGPKTKHGFRAGPNNVFFYALEAMRAHWGYSLYMETDCVPIRPNWLGQLNTHLHGAEPAWVTGSIYRGADALGPREKRHINGNALYATADPDFQHFVDTVWRPKLAEIIAERPELPFDCVIEALYELADARLGDADADWRTLRNVSHKFRYSALIPNLTSESGTLHALADQIESLLHVSPESCMVHTRTLAGFVGALHTSGSIPSMPELLAIMREAADGLPPRPPVSRNARKSESRWSVDRVRQGLARRLPRSIKRLID
jgi:hypothetical protein